MQVRWLKRAHKNPDEEAAYAARDDPEAAARIVGRIVTSVERLGAHPASGRPGLVPGTRELVVGGAVPCPYRVRAETVEILRVFHGPENSRKSSEGVETGGARSSTRGSAIPPIWLRGAELTLERLLG